MNHLTPEIAIAGELANRLRGIFRKDSGSGEWPDGFHFWADDFVEMIQMKNALSKTDLSFLPEDHGGLVALWERVALDLQGLWPNLLQIVEILVSQYDAESFGEAFGFTDHEWEMLSERFIP